MGSEEPQSAKMVTVAVAAERLTRSGDRIDASNVSRYLARFRDIPQKRMGKFRLVDLTALVKHRSENVLVSEKRVARGVDANELSELPAQKRPPAPPAASLDPDTADADPTTPIGQANLELKRLQIRNQQLDLDEREGRVVPAAEVLSLISTVVQVFVEAMVREESDTTQRLGRETGAEVRKARKAGQAKAAAKLVEIAQKHLPPPVALAVAATPFKDD